MKIGAHGEITQAFGLRPFGVALRAIGAAGGAVELALCLSGVRISAFKQRQLRASKRFAKIGAPGEIRTPDHCVRSAVLYPAELRALGRCSLPVRSVGGK